MVLSRCSPLGGSQQRFTAGLGPRGPQKEIKSWELAFALQHQPGARPQQGGEGTERLWSTGSDARLL